MASSLSRRFSLGSPTQPAATSSSPDLKQRVITCLNKLADRDTLAMATAELDAIARNLSHDSFATFLICIHNTDSSSKPPVRKQCVSLLALLSNSHGDVLAPFLSKMISTIQRRLRDPDSAVRSACVDAVAAMSSQITTPSFSSAFLKPLMDTLAMEQDSNSQIGSALCLAAAIDAAPDPDPAQLKRSLARLGKLAKSESFKAKSALLVLVGSIVGAGGASNRGVLDWLVPCVVEFLSSEDWAVRKAAAEALGKVASVERDLTAMYKASCLNVLESRRFDKVKVVRETMNHTLELWKVLIAGDSEENSAPIQSRSSTDNGFGRCFPPISKSSDDSNFRTPQPKKTVPTTNRSPPSDGSLVTTAKKGNERKSETSLFSKQDHKKPSDWKIEIAMPNSPSSKLVRKDDILRSDSGDPEAGKNEHIGNNMPETKRVLFSKIHDEKVHKFGGLKSGSRVVPFNEDENFDSDIVVSNAAEEAYESQKDAEDLNLIREQLLQIENQQSSLLNLLQRFIGSSQSGLNSLETRVHGLEMALDEISYDLAITSGRIPNTESAENTCCKLPGAEFLSSKFWRRTDGRCSTARLSSGTIPSLDAIPNIPNRDNSAESCAYDSERFQHQSRGAFTVNSVAEIHDAQRLNTRHYPDKTPKTIVRDAERVQACNASRLGISPITSIASRNPSRRSSA
ncbi:hypothetical protein PRUPE_1G262400 [Prunus persica]|uniref:TORTIFOLIA1/SINE1-2 N-terminal domain-containing protein n=1 Tax=Prunus persica TaxID=3760 RepID=A0A251R3P0_PRUPE|nr:TORTIFOLIA1-like protein 4 [Prunus persica]ONI30616.1 hypothetical protein PRUPE_1G262400 [Prunus persica]